MVSPKYPCASAVSILIWEQAEQAPVHLSMILRWPGFQSDATHKWNFVGILLSNQSDFKNPELIFAWRFQQVAARGKSLSVPRTNFPIIILTIEIAGATTRIQITAGSKKTLFIVQKKNNSNRYKSRNGSNYSLIISCALICIDGSQCGNWEQSHDHVLCDHSSELQSAQGQASCFWTNTGKGSFPKNSG